MNETRFTAKLKEHLLRTYPGILWQKHSDRFTTGIADVECVFKGRTIWLEIKVKAGLSAVVNLVGMGQGKIRPLQLEFLSARAARGIGAYGVWHTPYGVSLWTPARLQFDIGTELLKTTSVPLKDMIIPDFEHRSQDLDALHSTLESKQ